MKTDVPLKVLFQHYARDLLALTGDLGAEVKSADVIEIQAVQRTVDYVLRLERDGETYLRHLEFQAEPDGEMAKRCFRYNSQLVLQHNLPVLTTVVYLFPPEPKEEPVFRVVLGGREINRWRFETLLLWKLDAELGSRQALRACWRWSR